MTDVMKGATENISEDFPVGIRALNADLITHSLVTIEQAHHEIHEGNAFTMSRGVTLPVAADDELLIVTPNTAKWAHIVWQINSDGDFSVSFYEGTGLLTPTDITSTIQNRDRNSSVATGLTIGHTPSTGAGDGSLIWSLSGGAKDTLSTAENRFEFILKQNTPYLLRVSGLQGDEVAVLLDWYEHTNRA